MTDKPTKNAEYQQKHRDTLKKQKPIVKDIIEKLRELIAAYDKT